MFVLMEIVFSGLTTPSTCDSVVESEKFVFPLQDIHSLLYIDPTGSTTIMAFTVQPRLGK